MTDQPKRRPSNKGKFFDVMRPGDAPASSTSRPVITNQHPQAHDITINTKPVQATPNSRSAPVRQKFTDFKPLTNIRPRSAPVRNDEPDAAVDEPNGDSLFKHVDDEPLIEYSQRSGRKKFMTALLLIIAALIVVAIVVDVLLDMGTLTFNIPHTHFLNH
jgi:hypothetical protein